MRQIWKYPLERFRVVTHEVPQGGKVLCVQSQFNAPCVWIEIDPDAKPEMRSFIIVGTGFKIPDGADKYIGTFQQDGGAFIWHVYETKRGVVQP